MKNTLLFTYSTNILIGLLTVNINSSLTPKIRKYATHSSKSFENETPLMFNLVVKMRPHAAAHPH